MYWPVKIFIKLTADHQRDCPINHNRVKTTITFKT